MEKIIRIWNSRLVAMESNVLSEIETVKKRY